MKSPEKMSASEYLKKPYARVLVPETDGSYRAEIMEFPGCIALGDTQAEALESLERVAESWIEATIEIGQKIPEPNEYQEYSGRLVVRLPKSAHRKAARLAALDGVSLNTFIVAAISTQMGEKSAQPVAVSRESTFSHHIISTAALLQSFTKPMSIARGKVKWVESDVSAHKGKSVDISTIWAGQDAPTIGDEQRQLVGATHAGN